MRLDRNINDDGRGKYALLRVRNLKDVKPEDRLELRAAMDMLEALGLVDFGEGIDNEFFVIKVRDQYAWAALSAYAAEARKDGEIEYARDVMDMACRSLSHPKSKKPD